LTETIHELVIAGEQAGFILEQMIDLLDKGVTVEGLLRLIEWRLSPPVVEPRSSRWIT
jgi:hypothetical protein